MTFFANHPHDPGAWSWKDPQFQDNQNAHIRALQVLVCGRVVVEVGLFLTALLSLILAFCSSAGRGLLVLVGGVGPFFGSQGYLLTDFSR